MTNQEQNKLNLLLTWSKHWQLIAQHWLARGFDFQHLYDEAIDGSDVCLREAEFLIMKVQNDKRTS